MNSSEDMCLPSTNSMQPVIDGNIDVAQTIMPYAQYQKLIVDGILTLSNLDSGILLTTPIAVDLMKII